MELPPYLQQLRELRVKSGLKQAAAATSMGVTQQSISLIESGKRSPDVPTLQRYAGAVGAEVVVAVTAAGSQRGALLEVVSGLEEDHVIAVLRFARLLPVLEGRDYRMRIKDLDILEEEYVVPVENDDGVPLVQGA